MNSTTCTHILSLFICGVETTALSPGNDRAVAQGVHGVVYQLTERSWCSLWLILEHETWALHVRDIIQNIIL